MQLFVGGDFRFVLQGQANVVQPVQQTMADEVIDCKVCEKAAIVANLATLQVNGELVILNFMGAAHQSSNFIFCEAHGKKSIFRAVVGKDVGERARDHGTKAKIG